MRARATLEWGTRIGGVGEVGGSSVRLSAVARMDWGRNDDGGLDSRSRAALELT
jgi:hypothetical protein